MYILLLTFYFVLGETWVGKIHWRRKWQPTPVILPGKFHGLRSLVGYSPWGHKESDTTERLHFHRPNIPGCYAILLFTALGLASITSHIHNWVLLLLWPHPSFFLEPFLQYSPVAYWTPTSLGSSSLSVVSFCLSYCSRGSQGKNTEVNKKNKIMK